jgi:GH15 family glucan-1,4-alpha-glucosidase
MYGLAGERWLPEVEVPWLRGYENSRPVRVGNAASLQEQLDVYGEVVDAYLHAARSGMKPDPRGRAVGRVMMDHLSRIWREPDDGIWEVRGGRQHFVHSKVMAWVAFDRAAANASLRSTLESARWRAIADDIRHDICRNGFDQELRSFVQAYGSKHVDASLLLLPLVGFLSPDDPRMRGTLETIEARLVRDGLVLRYDTETRHDGLPPGEGSFLACTFWLADNYTLVGRYDEAEAVFSRLLGLCNDVGLLAEEFDPRSGRMLGNFPQAFSHVGLINTALNLARSRGPARERAEPQEPTLI